MKKEEEVKKVLFSYDDCTGMQQDLGLGNSQTKILLRDIRLSTRSQKVIEKNAFIMIQEKNNQLESFLELSKLVIISKKNRQKSLKTWDFQQ